LYLSGSLHASLHTNFLHLNYGYSIDCHINSKSQATYQQELAQTESQVMMVFHSNGKAKLIQGMEKRPPPEKATDVLAWDKCDDATLRLCHGISVTHGASKTGDTGTGAVTKFRHRTELCTLTVVSRVQTGISA
jgi:hypothetical protein